MGNAAFPFAAVVTVLFASAAGGAPLFPSPLHISRQVHDSISEKTVVLEEYGYGNRLVAVRGGQTSIADYEKGELIEIDRDAGTYSITRFDALARAMQATSPPVQTSAAAAKVGAALKSVGVQQTKSGRSAEFFEAQIDAQQKLRVAVDRTQPLSRDALEVLLGSAYPGVRTNEQEAVLSAAKGNEAYGLPVEQQLSYEIDGQRVEFRSSVVRLGSEPPPAELVAIPAGARLVPSRIVAAAAELEQAEKPIK